MRVFFFLGGGGVPLQLLLGYMPEGNVQEDVWMAFSFRAQQCFADFQQFLAVP